jgi:LuxR family maltose regulon positive regulatory protein
MNKTMTIQNQLLATKFFLPTSPGTLILRPRLYALLDKALKHPFTLVSAPAGYGKTTLLSTWAHSQPAHNTEICWLSLDEEDNDPYLFWTSVLSALHTQDPLHFAALLSQLQSPVPLPLKLLLTQLINLLIESTHHLVLVLDDYHLITQEQVHTTLAYVIEHLSPHTHIILATRADPPLPLPLLRAQQRAGEIRTDHLRCTIEEIKAFFQHVVGISLPDQIIQEVTDRTEGWLVGLHLLGLSLPEHAHPATLLEEANGQQRYILDYLTQIVLQQQPLEIQTFLLSTCILERFSAPLCDAVMQQTGSQRMFQRIEQANLFVVSLDSKREWYRYHNLFAQALYTQLERLHPELVPTLHYRASLWYAQHNQTTQAIVHALHAEQWEWAADLIEQKSLPLMALTWGASEHQLTLLQDWLKRLPVEVVGSRPRLCLACVHLLWTVAPFSLLDTWFQAAKTKLTASLISPTPECDTSAMPTLQTQQESKDLLGEVITWHAYQQSFYKHGEKALTLCEQALSLLSPGNSVGRALVALPQLMAYYTSNANNAFSSVESGLQGCSLAQSAGHTTLAIILMGITAKHMIGAGRLHEAQQLTNRAIKLGKRPGGLQLPDVGWPAAFQAEILREWNQLSAAHSLAEEALELCQRTESLGLLIYIITGYTILLRISLSCGNLEAAFAALQQVERMSRKMNWPLFLHFSALYTTVDQVRLWLASGELDRAIYWAKTQGQGEQYGTPFAHERQQVALARILLAQDQPKVALQRLEPALQRATTGQRWGHTIEIHLLQASAYQRLQQETQALSALSEAIHLAEPEGYIRSFVDEGAPMADLLHQLRKHNAKHGPTSYLDTLLTAFQQKDKTHLPAEESTKPQLLPEPLSKREWEVLQLLAQGLSNQEIAKKLIIALDTVKRHVSHIFAKLSVDNRVQAVRRGRELGLLDTEN